MLFFGEEKKKYMIVHATERENRWKTAHEILPKDKSSAGFLYESGLLKKIFFFLDAPAITVQ